MSHIVTGYDRRGEKFLAATVSDQSGRRLITSLQEADTPLGGKDDVTPALVVPDGMAMVKTVKVDPEREVNGDEAARFELLQSLLEPEERFRVEVNWIKATGSWLGIQFRRERLSWLTDSYGIQGEEPLHRYGLRSLSLGHGYLEFCHRDDGDLIVLADILSPELSICFIYRGEILDVASLPFEAGLLDTESWRRELAISLKTVVNFRLAGLREAGIDSGVSSLILSGEITDEPFGDEVERLFGLRAASPRLLESCLGEAVDIDPRKGSGYLATLGLAAN